jgi:hypothetical protein
MARDTALLQEQSFHCARTAHALRTRVPQHRTSDTLYAAVGSDGEASSVVMESSVKVSVAARLARVWQQRV